MENRSRNSGASLSKPSLSKPSLSKPSPDISDAANINRPDQTPLDSNGSVENGSIEYNAIQYNAIQHNAIQYNAVQHNAIQYKDTSSERPPVNLSDRYARTQSKASAQRNSSGHSTSWGTHFFWLLATVSLFFAAWYLGPSLIERYQFAATRGRIQAQYEHATEQLKNEPLTNVSRAFQMVAQKINPSVVSVNTEKYGDDDNPDTMQRIAGEGSGVVLTSDGYILTNHHVVENSKRIEIVMSDRRVFEADVIGTDMSTDLAVLKINADDLIPAEWANSDEVEVGTLVWAVGNPYGLKQTITSGILSGKDRQGESSQYQEFLQTDAAVNPGNSGGPLVDSCGRVIGINTSIYGRRFQGISFAVPSVLAQYVYKQIRENGKVERGFLGVTPGVVYQHHAEALNLEDLDGALVREVGLETPASKAGFEPGDVIRSWDGNEVKNWRHLFRYVSMTKPYNCVNVELIRNGETKKLNVKVAEAPRERS